MTAMTIAIPTVVRWTEPSPQPPSGVAKNKKKVIHKKILLGEYVARRICLRYCKKLPYAGIIRFK